jgi:hypothetical protein
LDLVWLRLTAGSHGRTVGEQTVTDILWANARPEDHVEHISVHAAEDARVLIIALFLRAGPLGPASAAASGLRLARVAVSVSPMLAGWIVHLDDRGELEVPSEAD